MKRSIGAVGLALSLSLAACDEQSVAPEVAAPEAALPGGTAVEVRGRLVHTPSGAVFGVAEWAALEDRTPWLEPAAERVRRTGQAEPSRLPAGLQASVTGNPAPRVLCHTAAYACGQIPGLIPGSQIVYWGASQWQGASVADFAQFDLIYIHDGAGSYSEITSTKNTWGAATTGRLALTGVHFEHCSAGYGASSGPCRVLKASVEWIHAGVGTGLLMATQVAGPAAMPTVGPYAGVTFSDYGGGWDLVRITDPGHATMTGSTDASLSNFYNSSHSIFGAIGGFTSVAEICATMWSTYPGSCPSTFRPHFLVTSVAVADQDGDGVPDASDNCPTVSNPSQLDANGNGVGDSCESAPQVTISPASVSVPVGSSVTFTASATDSDHSQAQLSYEWRVNGLVQAGATGVTYTTSFTADATVRVTVRDPGLLSGFAEAEVTVVTDVTPPVILANVLGTLGDNGWYTSDVDIAWTVADAESAITSQTGCAAATVSSDTPAFTSSCAATSAGGSASESVTVKRDATAPVVEFSGNAGSYTVDQTVAITCSASDALSGLASDTCADVSGPAWSFLGANTLTASAVDLAGNSASAATSFTVQVTTASLCALTRSFVSHHGIANSLCVKLANAQAAADRGNANARANLIEAYIHEVAAQSDKALTAAQAALLTQLARAL